MSYKSIIVHLDTTERAHPRLELALRMAKQFGAHLTGVFSVFTPEPQAFHVMAGSAEYYRDQQNLRNERRTALERLFQAELSRAAVPGQWLAIDEYANLTVPRLARCADLIVVGQDNPNDPEAYIADHFQENLVMTSGRPVLMVPYAGSFPSPGSHVMVAWDGSREAARAVHDALPLMRQAKKTTLVTVNDAHTEPDRSRIPGSDIAAVVARHGIHLELMDIVTASTESTGDALLSQAADLGADLIVMGAYGHARWQELVMGGATRTMLRSMTVPVLMSH
ncbi:universal stress protein [Paraburkholderia phenazinium]|uniref:Universal stress protein family protein n=1 Tax=Paraburkholderia phenazinium TaxID=60549 RepID=A0A1G8BDQ7_9BURK|nr:universal stress protein [Paraburkholderia phenazinium]SDH31153.1 Universal stress protein family protein [Paraburkholderia phenazinium]